MASKAPTTKSSASKGAASKASGSKAPARSGASRTGASGRPGAKSSSKGKAAPVAAEKEEAKKPVVKTADLPTLSLIDEPAPKKRVVTKAKALPRIGEEEHAASTPVPVPVQEEVAVTEESVAESTESIPEGEDNRKVIHIKPPIQIKELAIQMEVPPFKIIKDLMGMQIFANINQSVEPEIAAKLCELYGFVFEREKRVAGGGVHRS